MLQKRTCDVVETLERSILQLSAIHRKTLVLVDLEDLSISEAAETLNFSENTIRVCLEHGRSSLLESLRESLGMPAGHALNFFRMEYNSPAARILLRLVELERSQKVKD